MMENFLVKRNWNEISSNEKSLWRNFISYLTILLVDFGEIKNSWFINVKRIWLLISHPEHLADVNHVCSHWYVYVFDDLAQTPKCGTRFNQDFFGFSSLFFCLFTGTTIKSQSVCTLNWRLIYIQSDKYAHSNQIVRTYTMVVLSMTRKKKRNFWCWLHVMNWCCHISKNKNVVPRRKNHFFPSHKNKKHTYIFNKLCWPFTEFYFFCLFSLCPSDRPTNEKNRLLQWTVRTGSSEQMNCVARNWYLLHHISPTTSGSIYFCRKVSRFNSMVCVCVCVCSSPQIFELFISGSDFKCWIFGYKQKHSIILCCFFLLLDFGHSCHSLIAL